ncbi:MAG: TRM11 family SAM-dependent methyltransferase [Acidimicrobiales bacterium]
MPWFALGDALVLSPPGLGPLTVREARQLNLDAAAISKDRRADVVGIRRPPDIFSLRTAEDVLAVAGTLPVRRTAAATAAALDNVALVDALAVVRRAERARRRRLRVVVRLSDERHFLRTDLRAALERKLGHLHGPEEAADQLWVIQTDPRTLYVGVRLRSRTRRGARPAERVGALRPAIAAAMVLCADRPRLALDPCCGAGTLLDEVAGAGGAAVGGDLDASAIRAASAYSAAVLLQLDSRRLPFASDSFEAVITNLPFGHRYDLQGTPVAWYRRTLAESLRVAGIVVVLAPPSAPFRQALGRTKAELRERHDLTVLGQRAAIWSLQRR